MHNSIKYELHSILSGKSKVRFRATIQTISCHLGKGEITSPKTEHSKQIRIQEEKKLKAYILATDLWIEQIEFSKIISSGAEQRVYLSDSKTVIKLNDAINYSSWKDYFQNLLLHNYFFS